MTGRAAGWYPADDTSVAPGGAVGSVLRWWTGTGWGASVDELDADPPPPPARYRDAEYVPDPVTQVVPAPPVTTGLPVGQRAARPSSAS